jgi:lipoate-protein ligase A
MGLWRVVPVEEGEAGALLARGVQLLDELAADPAPTLRWYRSTRTAIVLGRGQARALAAHSTSEVTVLQRFSGGGAVLLEPSMISLDVLVPAGLPLLMGDLGEVFGHIGRAWAGALEDLGVEDVEIYEGAGTARRRGSPREQLLGAVCYATVGRGEVLAGGRKLLGLAQRRRRPGALVQCGLLRTWQPGPLLEALGADPDDEEIAKAAIGLDQVFHAAHRRAPSDVEIRAAVEARMEQLARDL